MISIGSNAVKIMTCNLYFRLPRRYFMVIATRLSTGVVTLYFMIFNEASGEN